MRRQTEADGAMSDKLQFVDSIKASQLEATN
jgi:hypothetical protein